MSQASRGGAYKQRQRTSFGSPGGRPHGDRWGEERRDGRGRWSAKRKMAVMPRLPRGEDLETLSRELGVTAANAFWLLGAVAGRTVRQLPKPSNPHSGTIVTQKGTSSRLAFRCLGALPNKILMLSICLPHVGSYLGRQIVRYLGVKILSTSEVAKVVGVHPGTLERWLASGQLRRPKLLISGRSIVRLWRQQDVKRVRQYKAANYKNKKPHGPTLKKIKRWQDPRQHE